jgi:hypothetical protein
MQVLSIPRSAVHGLALVTVLGAGLLAAPLAPDHSATGVWSGTIDLGGVARPFAVALHQREDGSLLGYVLGGTSRRTITGGVQSGSSVTFALELADPADTRTFTVAATVTANALDGMADDGGSAVPIHWSRVHKELLERRFLFAALPAGGGDPGPIVELAVAQRKGNGVLTAGGFVGEQDCGFLACGGGVTAFDANDNGLGEETVDIALESAGGCPGTGAIHATFDPASTFYAGTFSFTDCMGPTSGDVIGARIARATSKDAAAVLTSYGALADALERDASLGASDVPIALTYEHLGQTLADRLAELNLQIATYDDIEVELSRFRALSTVLESDVPSGFSTTFGVDFADRRSGAVGGMPVVFRDVDTTDGHDELKYIAQEGKAWLISGNHVTHGIPLAGYTLSAEHIVAPTAGGDVFVSIGPWGAHHGPHTGHAEGNAKADWAALYAHRLDQLVELSGDADGVCESGETCGVAQADIEARVLDYVVPSSPFEVTEVFLERLDPPGVYFGTNEHWRVRGSTSHYGYDFVHLREISAGLRDAMIAAGYTDPWTVHAPSANLIAGPGVALSAGATIAKPQTLADPVPGHPGFFTGKFGYPETPWQQLEFFTRNGSTGRDESYYRWLAPGLEAQLAALLEAEGLNPVSFRYHQPFLVGVERGWRAEMALSNQPWMDRDDYSTVSSALGGWWESTGGPCDGMSVLCDELFSIFPIRKDTVFYDAALYHSADVSNLAIHVSAGVPERFGEVVTPAAPDPIAGTLVIKWRNFGGMLLGYQGLAYRVDTPGRRLRVSWGPTVAAEGFVVVPPIPANTDVCDGTTLTCHDHDRPGG